MSWTQRSYCTLPVVAVFVCGVVPSLSSFYCSNKASSHPASTCSISPYRIRTNIIIRYDRTQIGFLESSTGLLDTSKMGRHIVDWMPDGSESDETVKRGEFTASKHMSVSNAFAAHGLDLLAQVRVMTFENERNLTIK